MKEKKQIKKTMEEKKYYSRRLRTIEGQIRGIEQMILDDRYCDDILIQISAINKSLQGIATELLKTHLSTNVVRDIQAGKIEVIDDVMNMFRRLD